MIKDTKSLIPAIPAWFKTFGYSLFDNLLNYLELLDCLVVVADDQVCVVDVVAWEDVCISVSKYINIGQTD